MELVQTWFGRGLALLLILPIAACEQGVQESQTATPAAEEAVVEEPAMPEPAAVEDRFANMFVSEVTDSFNPGLQVGESFPAIRAIYQGEEIANIDRFIKDKGAVFIAMRSVDW